MCLETRDKEEIRRSVHRALLERGQNDAGQGLVGQQDLTIECRSINEAQSSHYPNCDSQGLSQEKSQEISWELPQELDMSSVAFISFMITLENEWKIELDPDKIWGDDSRTLERLVNYIHASACHGC